MINPHQGEVGITIGGKEYVLLFNNRAIASLERALEVKSLNDMILMMNTDRLTFGTLIQFIKIGLTARHGEKEADEIANEMLPKQTLELFPSVMEAFRQAMPIADEEDGARPIKAEGKNQTNGVGLSS